MERNNSEQQNNSQKSDVNKEKAENSTEYVQDNTATTPVSEQDVEKATNTDEQVKQDEKRGAEVLPNDDTTEASDIALDNSAEKQENQPPVNTQPNILDENDIDSFFSSSTSEEASDKADKEQPTIKVFPYDKQTNNQKNISGNPNKKVKSAKIPHLKGIAIAAGMLIIGVYATVAGFSTGVSPQASEAIDPESLVSYKYKEIFSKGITIEGIDISGKTQEEAAGLLAIKGDNILKNFTVNINYGEDILQYTQNDFVVSTNVPETVEKAMEYSRKLKNGESYDQLEADPYITVDKDSGIVNFEIKTTVSEDSINKVVNKIKDQWEIPMCEPTIDTLDFDKPLDKMCTYKQGSDGVLLDTEKLKNDFLKLFINGGISGTLTVSGYTKQPTKTIDDIKGCISLLSEYTTVSENTENGNSNMKLSLEAVNGTIVNAGEVFSFNKCTGDSNLSENGYLPADVIENGTIVQGNGGGICQTSTTIYNAAIRANMGIIERKPHYYCSSYAYSGLDAAINYPNLDLKLRNDTEYPMFFKCWMEGVTLHVQVYGWQDPSYDKILTPSQFGIISSVGYDATAQKVFYKNGTEVKREDLPNSNYVLAGGASSQPCDPGTE